MRVTDGLIGEAQIYVIFGRSIQDNFHLICYTLERFNSKPGKGGKLVQLDEAKAFDRVEHPYLVSVLIQFGIFGWTIAIYDNINMIIRVNGFLSKPFCIKCLVRQWGPLSQLLYVVS